MTNAENIFDAIDSAPLVCFLDVGVTSPIFYGPFAPDGAADFIGKWNEFFAERDMPGTWVAMPVVNPHHLPA